MLLLLPPDVRSHMLTFVTGRTDRQSLRLKQNVLSSCKALRGTLGKKKGRHPTHAQQARMLKECYYHPFEFKIPDVPFDNPFILELFRAWEAPHTHRALVRWVKNQRINIDEGGLFAEMPWLCIVLNAENVRCFRIRLKLWDRVSTTSELLLDRYGDMRWAWTLEPGLRGRAYHTGLDL
jgi:hypothetical protein